MNPIEWLLRSGSGFRDLGENEREAAMHFALLWSLFESGALNTHGNAQSIVAAAKLWQDEDLTTGQIFARELAYFRNRYCADGEMTGRFEGLYRRRDNQRELVEKLLRGEEAPLFEIAAAVLIIVYRLRNNYFHGVKWGYGIKGQLENFAHANNALMQAIEIHQRSSGARY